MAKIESLHGTTPAEIFQSGLENLGEIQAVSAFGTSELSGIVRRRGIESPLLFRLGTRGSVFCTK